MNKARADKNTNDLIFTDNFLHLNVEGHRGEARASKAAWRRNTEAPGRTVRNSTPLLQDDKIAPDISRGGIRGGC